jgi:hypothetical protein
MGVEAVAQPERHSAVKRVDAYTHLWLSHKTQSGRSALDRHRFVDSLQ